MNWSSLAAGVVGQLVPRIHPSAFAFQARGPQAHTTALIAHGNQRSIGPCGCVPNAYGCSHLPSPGFLCCTGDRGVGKEAQSLPCWPGALPLSHSPHTHTEGFYCSTAPPHSTPNTPHFLNLSLQLLSCLLNSRKEIIKNFFLFTQRLARCWENSCFLSFLGETRLPGSIKGWRNLSRSQLGGTHRATLTLNLTLKIATVPWELGSGLGVACRSRAGSDVSPKMSTVGLGPSTNQPAWMPARGPEIKGDLSAEWLPAEGPL